MYIFFNRNGVLKEIIGERTFRNGDSKRDKIYIYWEGEASVSAGWVKFVKADSTQTPEIKFYDPNTTPPTGRIVGLELPSEPVRNLEYFNYDHTYEDATGHHIGYQFYEIEVPDEVLASATGDNNVCVAILRFAFVDGTEIELDQMGAIPFAVEATAGIIPDGSISETQYNYLVKIYSDNEIVPNPGGTFTDTLSSIRIKGVNYGIAGGGGGSGDPDQILQTIDKKAGSNFSIYTIKGKNYTTAVEEEIKIRPVEYTKKVAVKDKELSITNVANDAETTSAYGVTTTGLALNSDLAAEITRAKNAENTKVDKYFKDAYGNVNQVVNANGNEGATLYSESVASAPYSAYKIAITTNTATASTEGLAWEAYAINKSDNKGTRLIGKQNKIYYTKDKANYNVEDGDEIARIKDIPVLGNYINYLGKVPGTSEEYNLPYYFYTEIAKDNVVVHAKTIKLDNSKTQGDYSMVIAGATQDKAGLLTGDDKKALDQLKSDTDKEGAIRLLGKVGEVGSENEPYHFSYNYGFTQSATGITLAIDTLTLDNKYTKKQFTQVIPTADTSKAGLMSAQDKTDLAAKQNAKDDTLSTTSKEIVGSINELKGITDALSGKITTEVVTALPDPLSKNTMYWVGPDTSGYYQRWLVGEDITKKYDLGSSKIDLSTYYTKTEVDNGFIKQLGPEEVSGEQFHFAYYYDVQYVADGINVAIYTVTLDGKKTLKNYTYKILTATQEKAGVMSSADKKALDEHLINTNNPHNVTAASIKLDKVDNTSDAEKPVSTAQQEALDKKINLIGPEAVSKQPYHFPYHLTLEALEDSAKITAYTVTLDNTETLNKYDFIFPTATTDAAGLLSKSDKQKLDNIDLSIYQTKDNLDKTVPTEASKISEDKYLSTKATLEEIDKKENKLPTYEANKYLMGYEDTTAGVVKLKWESIGRSSSEKGDIISSSTLDTLGKVTARYGGDYWQLINYDTNYYQWWRNDVLPTYYACLGMRMNSTMMINKQFLYDMNVQGADFKLLNNSQGNYQWEVSDMTGYAQSILPAYPGLLIQNNHYKTAAEIEAIYGGTFEIYSDGYLRSDNYTKASIFTRDTTNFEYDSATNSYANKVATTQGSAEIKLQYCDSAKAVVSDIATLTDTDVKYAIPASSIRTDCKYIAISQRELILGYLEIPNVPYNNLIIEYDITDNDSSVVSGFKLVGLDMYGETDTGVYQFHCTAHDPLTNKIKVNIGDIICNTNCDTEAKLLDYYESVAGGTTGLHFGSDDGQGVPMATYTDGGVTVYQWRCLAA